MSVAARRSILPALGLLLLLASTAFPQTGTWSRLSVRRGFASTAHAYDESRGCVWMFGGLRNQIETNDLFTLSPGAPSPWSVQHPVGVLPAPRWAAAMVRDHVRDRMILFGGRSSTGTFSDLWRLELGAQPRWSAIATTGTPPSGAGDPVATFDEAGDRMFVVMLGADGLPHTWMLSFSGTPTWVALPLSGAAPFAAVRGVFVDPDGARLLLAGTSVVTNQDPALSVWQAPLATLDAWTPLATGASAITLPVSAGLALDRTHGRLLAWGGLGYRAPDATTFALDLTGPAIWSAVPSLGTSPPVRREHIVEYDRRHDAIVVSSGYLNPFDFDIVEYHDDVWTLPLDATATPATWRMHAADSQRPPQRLAGHALVLDSVRSALWSIGGASGPAGNGLTLLRLPLEGDPAWQRIVPQGEALANRSSLQAFHDPQGDLVLIYGGATSSDGGYSYSSPQNDVYALSLTPPYAMTRLLPAGTPPTPRTGTIAGFDSRTRRLIVAAGDTVHVLDVTQPLEWHATPAPGGPGYLLSAPNAVLDAAGARLLQLRPEYPNSTLWSLSIEPPFTWSVVGQQLPAISGMGLALDPTTGRLLAMGGNPLSSPFIASDPLESSNQSFASDGAGSSVWTTIPVGSLAPLGRAGHRVVFDPARLRLYVFGGAYRPASALDTRWVFTDLWSLQLQGPLAAPPASRPSSLVLAAPRPNPSRGTCVLRLSLPTHEHVSLDLFDAQGRRVRNLLDADLPPGELTPEWDLRDERGARVAPGLYFAVLRQGDVRTAQRVVVLE